MDLVRRLSRAATHTASSSSPTPPAHLTLLPELWHLVCAHLASSTDGTCALSRLARCSRQLHAISAPHLHSTLILDARTVGLLCARSAGRSARRRAADNARAACAHATHLVLPAAVPARLWRLARPRFALGDTRLFPRATRATVLVAGLAARGGKAAALARGVARLLLRHTAVAHLCMWYRDPATAYDAPAAPSPRKIKEAISALVDALAAGGPPLESATLHAWHWLDDVPAISAAALAIYATYTPGAPSSPPPPVLLEALRSLGAATSPHAQTFGLVAAPPDGADLDLYRIARRGTAPRAAAAKWYAHANAQTARPTARGSTAPWPRVSGRGKAGPCVCCAHTTTYPVRPSILA